jgi:hypothetical protein
MLRNKLAIVLSGPQQSKPKFKRRPGSKNEWEDRREASSAALEPSPILKQASAKLHSKEKNEQTINCIIGFAKIQGELRWRVG